MLCRQLPIHRGHARDGDDLLARQRVIALGGSRPKIFGSS